VRDQERGQRGPKVYSLHAPEVAKQKRRVTLQIKREMRRRSAIEPVIGHLKSEHRMTATISPAATATPTPAVAPVPRRNEGALP
jgi:hypothetical protein